MALSYQEINKVHTQQATKQNGTMEEFLDKDNFEKLKGIMYPLRVQAGSYLFWEGDDTAKLYYVRSGRVKLRLSTEDGKDLILSIMNKGDLIGEYGGCGTKHSFSAEVIDDAEIGVIQVKDLEILLHQHGSLAVQMMNWFGMMQRRNQSKFRDLLLFGKAGALASTLIRMSNTYGVICKDGILLDIKLTNTEIAEMIGMTRESVNRFLNSWKDDGTLEIINGHIVIRKIDNLRCICNCPTYPSCPKEICRI